MSRYEIMQREYLAVLGGNPSYCSGDLDRPVESVSWSEAKDYCAGLTAQERRAGRLPAGYVYRLPTEAEWEYACRAGTTNRFSHGDDPDYSGLAQYAWYGRLGGNTTHPVGEKRPNAWGLYDMHGNVGEWCLDWDGAYRGGSVTDPAPSAGSGPVARGGGWQYPGRSCRSAFRDGFYPGFKSDYLGFRPVLAPE
jgi:formylglycine-generating enzyme required for sulfatase activity